ncbi:MAG: C2H2-type zinc finger protein [Thermoplasmata archaeon]|nr:C2H2-type zinc finger protein [Thermoplasmata archaeon]
MSEECSTCGAMFASPVDLVAHMGAAHQHEDPTASNALNPEAERPGYVCGLCGERFATPALLAAHNLSRPERRRAAQRASELATA